MRKLLVVCVVVAICVGMATAGKKERARKERRKEGKRARPQADAVQSDPSITPSTSNPKEEQPPTVPETDPNQPDSPSNPEDQAPTKTDRHPPRCSEWVWGSCEVRDGRTCGRGVERATRDGENCKKKEQDRPCRVYCKERAQGDKAREGKKKGSGSKDRQNDGSPKGSSARDPPKRNKADKEDEDDSPGKCKYDKKDWTECDEQTSLQMRTFTLKSGDPTLCDQKKVITKPCDKFQRRLENKNDCEYILGPWGYCNATSDMRRRRDTLIDESKETAGCRLVREIHQRCAVACMYTWGEWSECDEEEQKRLIVGTLERDDITPPDCQNTMTRTKPCYGKNGVEKCLFGPWSGFGKCVEGFKLRTRKLLVGDRRCELRASHAVPCKG
ncbi:uncharacterized protein LOC117305338 [Asterias rubens]|uniref:uncharacterized protein LOC117305338 n=1 Tax=Asterias rubens TaxID=7604 RepID=UPI001455D793|nr:uncharacterized protein LOC117305338 [Asterias rubens]XP_033646090.1 uncharacterized protein LOC117305338 [Asterias rubens]